MAGKSTERLVLAAAADGRLGRGDLGDLGDLGE